MKHHWFLEWFATPLENYVRSICLRLYTMYKQTDQFASPWNLGTYHIWTRYILITKENKFPILWCHTLGTTFKALQSFNRHGNSPVIIRSFQSGLQNGPELLCIHKPTNSFLHQLFRCTSVSQNIKGLLYYTMHVITTLKLDLYYEEKTIQSCKLILKREICEFLLCNYLFILLDFNFTKIVYHIYVLFSLV